jgi:hypothetical protein
MTPAGYMAKRVSKQPEWLKTTQVSDVYSLSACFSANFADYINYWKHNGFWLFDSPELIREVAREHSVDLAGTSLFYYEVHALEFDGKGWRAFARDPAFVTNVLVPSRTQLEGFDVATFANGNAPECSPLSCNRLAEELPTNSHCLFASFDEAERSLTNGAFDGTEPGPYRIFSVSSVG